MRSVTLFVALTAASPAMAAPPIIGGEIDAGDPAVVLLAAYPQDRSTLFTCTAVVIAPNALLTVAHCVDHPGFLFGVFFGADATPYPTLVELEPQLAAVSAVHPHADYTRTAPFFADIAVVELALPTAIVPLTFARTPPTTDMVGGDVRIVGYGQTTFGVNNSAKYAGTTVIAGLDADDTILIGNQVRTCVGDSGGPALLDGVVLGVDSYSDTTGCADPAHFRRTDAFAAFIDQFAGTSPDDPPPPPDDPVDDPPSPESGGCATSSGASLFAALGLLLIRRRRR
jgi:secreted trypsin-like serine protease